MAEGADGAGELADAHVFGGGGEASLIALHFGVPVEELEAEGGGLGVDAVGASDDGGVLELNGAALEDCEKSVDAGAEEGGGFLHLQGLSGIYDVVRGEAVVQPAGLFAEPLRLQGFSNCGGEGNDVVLDFRFDLLDSGDGKTCTGGDGVGGWGGDDAIFGQDRAGCGFDLKPAAVFIFFGPDAAHGRACIAIDQRKSSSIRFIILRLYFTSSPMARGLGHRAISKCIHARGIPNFACSSSKSRPRPGL